MDPLTFEATEPVRNLNRLEYLLQSGCDFMLAGELHSARHIGSLTLNKVLSAISIGSLQVIKSSLPQQPKPVSMADLPWTPRRPVYARSAQLQ